GGSNHGIPQDVSEHEFNTSGLSTWAGLKPPAPGSRPDVRILGVPLDRGSLYRPGAAKAPAQLRKMSAIFAPVSEQAELFDTVTLQDDGDVALVDRSEERRVGKECRARGGREHEKKNVGSGEQGRVKRRM